MIDKFFKHLGFNISTIASCALFYAIWAGASSSSVILIMAIIVVGLIAQISLTLGYILDHLEKRPQEPTDVH